jgi:hypothetical protein
VKQPINFQYGYYVFLGLGDYHKPRVLNADWIAAWEIKEWVVFLEKLVQLKTNTLMIYLNGHLLPYKSYCYPELVEPNHPNVKNEFFSTVLSLAKSYGINTIIVLSTTGHSEKYLENNPSLSIKIRSYDINLDELLAPFPDHIRKMKNIAQIGNAQVGLGTLCHNNLKSKKYAINLIKECLSIYPQVNSVALHPPESIYPCFCDCCRKLFKIKYEKDLLDMSNEIAQEFYIETYLNFQRDFLENEIKILLPKVQLYTFTVPWLFERSFNKIVNYISKDTIIIDWDYNLNPSRINQLNKRLLDYQAHGHSVWFMPTSGFGLDQSRQIQEQISKVKKQMEIAVASNVSGIVHFVGPSFIMDLKKTNFYFSVI